MKKKVYDWKKRDKISQRKTKTVRRGYNFKI